MVSKLSWAIGIYGKMIFAFMLELFPQLQYNIFDEVLAMLSRLIIRTLYWVPISRHTVYSNHNSQGSLLIVIIRMLIFSSTNVHVLSRIYT